MTIEQFKKHWEETAKANPLPEHSDLTPPAHVNGASDEVLAFLDQIGAADEAHLATLLAVGV